MDQVADRCRWRVFSTVLLDNHFHIFLRTPEPNLSIGMHDIEGGYATLFNGRHNRNGPLFQGRFHAVAVENDSHCWELSRYVHLNPFRAGLTNDPSSYWWSTYRHYLDPHRAPRWLDYQTVLAELGGTESAARLAYKRFVDAGTNSPVDDPLSNIVDGWILGGKQFVEACRARTEIRVDTPRPTVDRIVAGVCLRFDTSQEQLMKRGQHRNWPRDAAILLDRDLTMVPTNELAERFGGVSKSAVTEAVRRARKLVETEPAFGKMVQELEDELRQDTN